MSKTMILTAAVFAILSGQTHDIASQELTAYRTESAITADGVLDEPDWERTDAIRGLIQFVPVYDAPSPFETTVRVLYDDSAIYVGFICRDPEPARITAKDTRRDAFFENDDAVVMLLDTFDDKNSAYYFGVNPNGTQQDGRLADNGRTDDISWDGTWQASARITPDGWICEIVIPLETLRYDAALTSWGFTVERRVARNRERSFWIGGLVDVNRVSSFGALTGLDIGAASVKRFTVIPYAQVQAARGHEPKDEYGAGFRYNPTSNLGLEATVNPDFATVEADVEQVNLTRFELSYPEKRPFFQEGAENYSTRIRQFYSRRIGEIPWGVKLNGKTGVWQLNSLVAASDPATGGAAVGAGEDALYTVFRLNRELPRGSTLGLIGANRSYREENSGSLGLAATLFFTDVIGMTSQVIETWGEAEGGTWTGFVRPSYDSQFSHFHVRYSHVGTGVMENMNPTGFITDDDRREVDTNLRRQFWINSHGIDQIIAHINYNRYWSQQGRLRRWEDTNRFTVQFLKKWEWTMMHTEEFIRYEKDFRNSRLINAIQYDSKTGTVASAQYTFGKNYDRDFDTITGGLGVKLIEGWDVEYHLSRHWFSPGSVEDNSWIHYVRSTYYLTPDLFFKLFYQTRYSLYGEEDLFDYDLLRKNLQVLFVWRFLPPFGSLQLAYQEGSIRTTDTSDTDLKAFFCKLSWTL